LAGKAVDCHTHPVALLAFDNEIILELGALARSFPSMQLPP
jgi:hypothetical protein